MSDQPQLTGVARVAMIAAVMLAMMLEMLDLTIVNVALPHMMGSFGATNDQITWVVASYMVSSAVVMPLSGYLVQRFGRRRLLLVSVSLFLISSAACGASQTLEQMVAFRLIQGGSGATMLPLSQAVLISAFTPETRGRAMALWGLGLMVVPVLGPTIGGFITDQLGWRWVFYVNIPIGALALLLAASYVPPERGYRAHTDWMGLALLVVFVGSLQLILNQGNERQWFDSTMIQVLTLISTVAGLWFIEHCWDRPGAIVNLVVFRDRNFTISCVMTVGFALSMFGTMALLPLMLEQLMHYPAEMVGNTMAPRGIAMAFTIILFGRLANKLEGRVVMVAGSFIMAGGTYIYALLPIEASPLWVSLPGALQGVGMGMYFIPSATMVYETLPKHLYDGAAGVYSVMRTLGGSLGVAIIGIMIGRRETYHWRMLGENVTADNPRVHEWLDARGLSMGDPQAAGALVGAVAQQAQALTFSDMFTMIALVSAALAPLVLLQKKAAVLKIAQPQPAE